METDAERVIVTPRPSSPGSDFETLERVGSLPSLTGEGAHPLGPSLDAARCKSAARTASSSNPSQTDLPTQDPRDEALAERLTRDEHPDPLPRLAGPSCLLGRLHRIRHGGKAT